MLALILTAVGAYCLGAVPFSLWIAMAHHINLRQVGSGNLGTTNVVRALGWKWGGVVLLLDALKGFIPTWVALTISDNPWVHIGVGILAIIGHSLTFFAGFKGGKGVATGIGVLFAISPDVAGIVFAGALIGIAMTRYVAPFSLLACLLTPFLLWKFEYPFAYSFCVALIGVYIIWRHRANISRLIQGKENRL